MFEDMLGRLVALIVKVPAQMLGALCDLAEKLASKSGREWYTELRHFLRKDPCWTVRETKVYLRRLFEAETIKLGDTVVGVYELIADGTLLQIAESLGSPDQFCLSTDQQISEFCRNHQEKVRGHRNVFFFQGDGHGDFIAPYARSGEYGTKMCLCSDSERILCAKDRYIFVVPLTAFPKAVDGVTASESKIIKIDRSKPFDPASFIEEGWIIAEEDERSLALTEIDLRKVFLVTTLKKGEDRIEWEERQRRLRKTGYVRLDAKVLQTLLENPSLIPNEWEGEMIFFDGTTLRSSGSNNTNYQAALFLCQEDGKWRWHSDGSGMLWSRCHLSAILPG